MQPLDPAEIRASFINCSRGEAKSVTLPAEVPWEKRDFLGWRDVKAPGRAYLVVSHGDELIGLSLRAAPPPKSRLRSNICAFCTTTHPLADITLFTARLAGKAGRDGNTVGTYLCSDLACSAYLRGELRPAVPQPKETISQEEAVERMNEKISRFVARVLETR
ncbi:FBP domain-containing protein [Amycolatopsis rubida]|uniref:FBP domain-containing protein n=1 Tax=Amycolatopsis rubida TaxID=112413 RepID=A0ABX0C4C5_9PSEU|nr:MULTISPECIES: FBP domain-containing protein [Amycolatopsis]MYW97169.1 FBP domain-containing protein [Amycolatopsis rubida]NEC62154.1 FBP domain-containing protein [Amycolatopsis rubida]OAP24601.1 Fibronectin-binding protein (FBP) [Amycolatopsis sp. M39]